MGNHMPLTLNLLHFDRPADDQIIVREAWGAPSQNQSQLLGAKFSPDGRYSYFYSQAKLAQGDVNNEMDIYRKDFVTGEITLMSVKGVPTGHYDLDVSRDGRYLLFSSTANNLVTGDTNGFEDVFRMDLTTRAITRVSMSFSFLQGNGDSYSGRFSPDGQYVVFTSDANLAAAGDSNSWSDIYVRKFDSGGVMLVSTLPNGQQGNGTNWDAKFSADGSQVLFSSTGFNQSSGESQILIKDVTPGGNVITTGGDLKIVSVDKGNNWGTNHSLEAQITPDGRYVVFASLANNLVPLDLNGTYDIFRKDLQTGDIVRVSTTGNGNQAFGNSRQPQISADGRFVIFVSTADNLVAGDYNGAQDIFRKDLLTGQVIRLSESSNHADGRNPVGDSWNPQFSPNERYVLFDSFSNFVSGDTNYERDLYSVDLILKANTGAVQTRQYIELAFEVGQASSVSIAWGDGTSETVHPTGGAVAFNHAYWTGGLKTATVTVIEGGQSRTVSYMVDLGAGQITRNPSAPDSQSGSGGTDALTGDDFANILAGGAGNNSLKGMGGNDRLHGGIGRDTLWGGPGQDIFVFDSKPNKKTNIDRIVDFSVKDDAIWLDNAVFKALGKKGSPTAPAKLKKSFFTVGTKAQDASDHLIYNKKTGALFYDDDGAGRHAAVQIATLPKKLVTISHNDFFVV